MLIRNNKGEVVGEMNTTRAVRIQRAKRTVSQIFLSTIADTSVNFVVPPRAYGHSGTHMLLLLHGYKVCD